MRIVKNILVCYITALTIFILTSNLHAATLTIGSASGSPGNKNISIPVELTSAPGEKVCGFNFDLCFDTSKLSFKEVALGSVAVGAGKSLSFNQPSSNIIRVVVIGLNQNLIGDGTVLTFSFDILDNAPVGKSALTITKASISDPNGKALPVNIEGVELSILK